MQNSFANLFTSVAGIITVVFVATQTLPASASGSNSARTQWVVVLYHANSASYMEKSNGHVAVWLTVQSAEKNAKLMANGPWSGNPQNVRVMTLEDAQRAVTTPALTAEQVSLLAVLEMHEAMDNNFCMANVEHASRAARNDFHTLWNAGTITRKYAGQAAPFYLTAEGRMVLADRKAREAR